MRFETQQINFAIYSVKIRDFDKHNLNEGSIWGSSKFFSNVTNATNE